MDATQHAFYGWIEFKPPILKWIAFLDCIHLSLRQICSVDLFLRWMMHNSSGFFQVELCLAKEWQMFFFFFPLSFCLEDHVVLWKMNFILQTDELHSKVDLLILVCKATAVP